MSHTYTRTKKRPRNTVAPDIEEDDDEHQVQNVETESATVMEEDELNEVPATEDRDGDFHFNDELLD